MSKHEVIDAYLRGKIDRREFVGRLTAVGVSAAAAVAYAQSLGSPTAAAPLSGGRGRVGVFQYVEDADGDGFTDEEEEECGSDPNDANSTCDNIDDDDDDEGPSTLPKTGSGDVAGGGSRWLTPLAAAGAGAALLARRLRRVGSDD